MKTQALHLPAHTEYIWLPFYYQLYQNIVFAQFFNYLSAVFYRPKSKYSHQVRQSLLYLFCQLHDQLEVSTTRTLEGAPVVDVSPAPDALLVRRSWPAEDESSRCLRG